MKKLLRNKRFYAALVMLGAAIYGANLTPEQTDQLAGLLTQLGSYIPV